VNLDEILEEWSRDCQIGHKLEETSRDTPKLHAKYLGLLMRAKLQLKQSESKQRLLLKDKFLWYNGKLSQEEVESNNWPPDPFDGLKVMKSDLNYWYESDKDIQASESRVVYFKTVVETLKEIVDALKWRHSTIRNMIEVRRFEAGA
jgi:hypothetical protein